MIEQNTLVIWLPLFPLNRCFVFLIWFMSNNASYLEMRSSWIDLFINFLCSLYSSCQMLLFYSRALLLCLCFTNTCNSIILKWYRLYAVEPITLFVIIYKLCVFIHIWLLLFMLWHIYILNMTSKIN